jgi:NAD(P)-dependent dehydrogenase (short-subunit alcohol dehydrogenase family)
MHLEPLLFEGEHAMAQQAEGKVAIITGASAGIGQSAALRIAERGAGVIITFNSHEERARETVAAIEKTGGTAVALPLDVGRSETFPGFVERAAAEMRRRWNRTTFDFLVNNAGFGGMSMFEDTTEELFDEFHRVLLKGPYFLTQKLLPLLADGGAIVNTTSNSALTTGLTPGYSAYASMKAGLTVLTRYLAKELSGRGIRVNSVAPGPTRTRIGDDAFARMPEVIPPLVARTALGRIGEPDDVGRVIAALLSDDFAWVTGENLEASGGFNL